MPEGADLVFSNNMGMGTCLVLSEDGAEWVAEHVELEPWQCIGGSFVLEGNCILALMAGATDDGLECEIV